MSDRYIYNKRIQNAAIRRRLDRPRGEHRFAIQSDEHLPVNERHFHEHRSADEIVRECGFVDRLLLVGRPEHHLARPHVDPELVHPVAVRHLHGERPVTRFNGDFGGDHHVAHGDAPRAGGAVRGTVREV